MGQNVERWLPRGGVRATKAQNRRNRQPVPRHFGGAQRLLPGFLSVLLACLCIRGPRAVVKYPFGGAIMAKSKKKKNKMSKAQQRAMRRQQIVMAAIGVLIILSFVITLIK